MSNELVTVAKAIVSQVQNYAASIIITDARSFEQAQLDLKELKKRIKDWEAELAKTVDPAKAIIAIAKAQWDPLIDAADHVEKAVKAKCMAWKQQAEAEKARKLLAAQATMQPTTPIAEQRTAIAAATKVQAPKVKGVAFIDNWKLRVTNPALVPERYWVRTLNTQLLQSDFDAGTRDIPGTEVYNDPYMTVR